MPLAYSYLRMSNADQIQGDSLRRQLERTRSYAEMHGLTLDDSLRDLGVSAYHGRNRLTGALARFLRLAEQGSVPAGSYLIVENLDRLSREAPRKALQPFLDLIESGIRIVTLSDEQVYDSARLDREPWGLMASLMVMTRANEESRIKSERVGAAWRRKHTLASEKKVTARCPGWLRLAADRKSFEVLPKEAAALHRAFELTAEGVGRQALARLLNSSKAPAPGGKRWHASSLARLLHSDAVLGVYQPHEVRNGVRTPRGTPIEGYYPAIVEPELVQRARAAMAERGVTSAGRRGKAHTNLFVGLCYCGICGGVMRIRYPGRDWKDNPTLKCGNAVDHVDNRVDEYKPGSLLARFPALRKNTSVRDAHKRSVPYRKFEEAFLRHVHEIDFGPIVKRQDDGVLVLEKDAATVAGDLAKKKREFTRLMAQFGTDESADDDDIGKHVRAVAGDIKALDARASDLKRQLARARAQTDSAAQRLSTIELLRRKMAKASGDALYQLRAHLAQEIRRVVTRITFNVSPALALTSTGVRFKPDAGMFGRVGIRTPGGDTDRYLIAPDGAFEVTHSAGEEAGDARAVARLRAKLAKLQGQPRRARAHPGG